MADIHREADDILTEQEAADAAHAEFEQCLDEVQWVITACRHYVGYHELTGHETVSLIEVAHEATLQKIRMLELG